MSLLASRLPVARCLATRAAVKGGAGGIPKVLRKTKVLFCTEDFPYSLKFTQEQFSQDPEVQVVSCKRSCLAEAICDAHVAVPLNSSLTKDVLENAKNLKMIIQYGVGLEGVDIEQASRQGIYVSNIPSADSPNALSCAEHAIYLILALLRRQNVMTEAVKNRRTGFPLGETLHGKRVLIVGFGGIAQRLIPLLKPFQVHLSAARKRPWSTSKNAAVEKELLEQLDDTWMMDQLPSVLPSIDIIVMACVQNEETEGMINDSFLSHCRDGVHIVNVCRGGLLDEAAVMDGLKTGKIGGLGLDVHWFEPIDPHHEITKFPNVILTPHIAGVTRPSYRKMAEILAREVQKIKAGHQPTRIVNLNLLQEDSNKNKR